jgi:hypothetical protein
MTEGYAQSLYTEMEGVLGLMSRKIGLGFACNVQYHWNSLYIKKTRVRLEVQSCCDDLARIDAPSHFISWKRRGKHMHSGLACLLSFLVARSIGTAQTCHSMKSAFRQRAISGLAWLRPEDLKVRRSVQIQVTNLSRAACLFDFSIAPVC